MATVIFGGSGFIGRQLASTLMALGEEVITADLAPPQLESGERFVSCDLRRFEDVVKILLDFRPERTVNLAYMLGSTKPPRTAIELNIRGTDNFFEASRVAEVEHVVFSSSLVVNGLQSNFGDRPVTEEDPLLGNTHQYATHKVFNEWQAQDYREKHGMKITSIRAANVSGHNKIFGSVDHVRCITEPVHGRPVSLPFADTMRSVILVEDVAKIFAALTLATRLKYSTYNTGGNPTSLGNLADTVRGHVNDARISFDQEAGGRAGSINYIIDNSRVKEEFGIELTPLDECVRLVVERTGTASV